MGQINDLVKEAFDTAWEKGFWEEPYTIKEDTPVEGCTLVLTEYKDNKLAIPTKLFLIAGELVEAGEKHHKQTKIGPEWREQFTEELADVCIRLFDLAGFMGLDLEWAIISKMAVNKTRPHKHGNAY